MYLPSSDTKASSVHEGVCDIIACLGADGVLRATPFIVKFAACVQDKPVTLWVNGEKTDVALKVNDKLEGYFELTQQEYHSEGLSKGDFTRVNHKTINGSLLADLDFNIEVSNCAQDWEATPEDQRPELFERNVVTQDDIVSQSDALVGKNRLVYKIGDVFYSEVEAWKVILNSKIGGAEIPTTKPDADPKKPSSSGNLQALGAKPAEKLINAFRPSNGLLKRMNLKMGENDLAYEYFISSTTTDKINVKIFLYPHTAKIVISDIDGTITK